MKGAPLAVTNALRSYFIPSSQIQLRKSQADLLNHFVKAKWTQHSIQLDSGDLMNCIDIKKDGASTSPHRTLLLTHGFGSGLGFFWANFDHLASLFDRVVAVVSNSTPFIICFMLCFI